MNTSLVLLLVYGAMARYHVSGIESRVSVYFKGHGLCNIFMGIRYKDSNLWAKREDWRRCLDSWPEFNGDHSFPITPKGWTGEGGRLRLSLFWHMYQHLDFDRTATVKYLKAPKGVKIYIHPLNFTEIAK